MDVHEWSGGEAKIQAALLIELLRGVQIELVERQGAAQALASDVAKRAVLPSEGGGKKQRSIAANKNIFIGILLSDRLGWYVVMRRCDRSLDVSGFLGFFLNVVALLGFLDGHRGSLLIVCIVRKNRPIVAAAIKREISSNKIAVSSVMVTPAMRSLRMDCRDVRIIKAKSGNIFREDRAVVARSSRNAGLARHWTEDNRSRTGANVMHAWIGMACVIV